jgi:CRP-like cAMP-binding protein
MSVFDAEPRSASVTTLEPCACLVLTQQQLYDAIDETPGIAVNVIRLLSRRIRELNQDLNRVKQQLAQAPQAKPLQPQWYRPLTYAPPAQSPPPASYGLGGDIS